MQKIFTYIETIMNGSVIIKTDVAAFADRDLAERTRKTVLEYNAHGRPDGLHLVCSEISETDLYECTGEVFILSDNIKTE